MEIIYPNDFVRFSMVSVSKVIVLFLRIEKRFPSILHF